MSMHVAIQGRAVWGRRMQQWNHARTIKEDVVSHWMCLLRRAGAVLLNARAGIVWVFHFKSERVGTCV